MNLRRTSARGMALAAGVCLITLVGQASPAMADTSQATARAVNASVLSGTVTAATTPTSASNNGEEGTVANSANPTLPTLNGLNLISAGVLVQKATAWADGSSAACSGVAGNGGTIAIGTDGTCSVSGGGGIVIQLTSALSIKADAIIGSCYAKSDGTVTAKATIANAKLYQKIVLESQLLDLSAQPTAPNTGVSVPGVISLVLNQQSTPNGPGSIRDTALHLSLLGVVGGLVADIGTVTCGQNAVTPPTPMLPVQSLPIAGGIVAVALWFGRHRVKTLAQTLRTSSR